MGNYVGFGKNFDYFRSVLKPKGNSLDVFDSEVFHFKKKFGGFIKYGF